MSSIPDNFDWVKARSECSIGRVFQKLKLQVEADISARNELTPKNPKFKFDMDAGTGFFVVTVADPTEIGGLTQNAVTFTLKGTEIIVKTWDEEIFTATLTLNNKGQCKLKIEKEEYDFWQVRKMALENLFFEAAR